MIKSVVTVICDVCKKSVPAVEHGNQRDSSYIAPSDWFTSHSGCHFCPSCSVKLGVKTEFVVEKLKYGR